MIGELQGIADSSDRMRRSRGRRGLDVLNQLQSNPNRWSVLIDDRDLPEFASGSRSIIKLVLLAKHVAGKDGDQRLQPEQGRQAARGRRRSIINDLANALKPVLLPGESDGRADCEAGRRGGPGGSATWTTAR